MKEQLQKLREQAMDELAKCEAQNELTEWKVQYLGKKGELTSILRGMGQLSPEKRPLVGQLVNDVRSALEHAYEQKEAELKRKALEEKLKAEAIDVTLPGRMVPVGVVHPLNRVIREIEDIFIGLGFEVAEGPEVETDYYNFEALNIPKNHPARDMQDTFYLTEEILMRTHTSPVQVRTLEAKKGTVPVRIICPGRVYRRDDDDATHSHLFTQVEGLVVDRQIRMSDLKGILLTFARQMFGPEQQIRLRPSYFPFTEPSTEVDVTCMACRGDGCRICKHTGWIEILGAGMVHPRVLEMAGYDSETYTGFAFGMGVERIAMLKYGVDDIRYFYVNDVRFLKQFASRS
ncbi:phenylalanine--tRNA ligase subunit alpha [Effusibacillus pohliae]|uniref:phenylalanine--tRNA ligase subunit alpha n=1 Tax=Effusibacillus pohliae TaxID=232270 RepID=UPI00036326C5|nr:phenylalanine--tRNA ligase subunit alpha [Effusibacillus pohliae]